MKKEERINLLKNIYPNDCQIVGQFTLNNLASQEDDIILDSYEIKGGDNMDFSSSIELISIAFGIISTFLQIRQQLKKPDIKNELMSYLKKKNKIIREEEFEILINELTDKYNE